MRGLDELLSALDEQVERLHARAVLMRALREGVLRDDLTALADLLSRQAEAEGEARAAEQRLLQIRRGVAGLADLPADRATLGRLAAALGGPAAIALNDRRERLLAAVENLRRESASTAHLVRHAVEFNSRLISALLGEGEGPTYSASGTVESVCQKGTFQQSV